MLLLLLSSSSNTNSAPGYRVSIPNCSERMHSLTSTKCIRSKPRTMQSLTVRPRLLTEQCTSYTLLRKLPNSSSNTVKPYAYNPNSHPLASSSTVDTTLPPRSAASGSHRKRACRTSSRRSLHDAPICRQHQEGKPHILHGHRELGLCMT